MGEAEIARGAGLFPNEAVVKAKKRRRHAANGTATRFQRGRVGGGKSRT
jgi:hypothetical protein